MRASIRLRCCRAVIIVPFAATCQFSRVGAGAATQLLAQSRAVCELSWIFIAAAPARRAGLAKEMRIQLCTAVRLKASKRALVASYIVHQPSKKPYSHVRTAVPRQTTYATSTAEAVFASF